MFPRLLHPLAELIVRVPFLPQVRRFRRALTRLDRTNCATRP